MAVSMIGPKFYAWDRNGKPLAFGKLYTYQARANTPKATYQSEDQVVENTNPVILNGEGYANVYLDGSYKMVLKDDKDNEIWSSDPVSSSQPDEWVNCFTATYVSPCALNIYSNVTDLYQPGRRIRIDNNEAEYSYSTVESSSFSNGITSITTADPSVKTGVVGVCASIVGPYSRLSYQVLKFDNIADAVSSELLRVGDSINLKERTSGVGGGGMWDVVDAASVTPNGYSIVESTGSLGLALVLRVSDSVSLSQVGVTGSGDESSAIEAAYSLGVAVVVDLDCEGSPSITAQKTSGTGFITGVVTITGSGMIADLGEINCSSLFVEGYQFLKAESINIDGDGFSEHGVETEPDVTDIYINKLFIKNAGGTVQYKSATAFKGTNGDKLQVNFADIRDCGYSGFTSSTIDGTLDPDIYSYEDVILGDIYVDGCGNTSNPAGDNQHHGCYLATAKKISFNKIIVNNQQRGYGIKFGSSVQRNMGHIKGSEIIVDGVTNGRGGLTFTEAYKSFNVGTGLIHGTDTTHAQWIHSGTSGDTNFGSMQFSETVNVPNQVSLDIKGSMNSLNISSCKFNGWADGGTRRGISDLIFIDENVVLDKFVCHGVRVDTIANHFLHIKGSDSAVGGKINEVSIVAPILQNCGGVFNVEHNANSSADIQRGMITGIAAEVGSLTNAWVLPARGRLQFEVRENTMRAGGTIVRLNDLSYTRMSNITTFDKTSWIDSDTGAAITEATFDTQQPDASLGDGYIGKVYNGSAWKNYGVIEA